MVTTDEKLEVDIVYDNKAVDFFSKLKDCMSGEISIFDSFFANFV